MSREKQIDIDIAVEEMASAIREITVKCGKCEYYKDGSCLKPVDLGCDINEDILNECDALYNASYRKQEWISVDERLPTVEEQGRGLVGIVNGYNGKIRFENARVFLNYDYNYNEWYSQDYDIQNCKIECWMPLPEAPKMKGGAD